MINLTSNIEELISKYKGIKEQLKNVDISDALVVGVNAARGAMSFRIFNKGLDAEGNSLGAYADEAWKKKRTKSGRQIQYKDLEYSGTLRRGILVIKESQVRVVCAIPNARNYLIATSQEEALKTKIFSLSNDENELLKTNVIAAVTQIYDRILNTNKPV